MRRLTLVLLTPVAAPLRLLGRARPVASLDRATHSYAHALSLHLGLDRGERRHLARVTDLAFARRADAGDVVAYARATLKDPSRAPWESGHVGEWWNGSGGPAGLRDPAIPIAARIVAFAGCWAALTAHDTPQKSHADALNELRAAAGTRFDTHVVEQDRSVEMRSFLRASFRGQCANSGPRVRMAEKRRGGASRGRASRPPVDRLKGRD